MSQGRTMESVARADRAARKWACRVGGGAADQQGSVDHISTLLLQSEMRCHLSRRVTQFDFRFKRVILAATWK